MNTTSGTQARAAALLVLVAAFGFVAGIITDRLVLSGTPAVAADAPAAPDEFRVLLRGRDAPAANGERRFGVIMLPERLAGQLDLTPAQQAEIERILAEDQAVMRELTEQFHPRLAQLVERTRQRIAEVLTEEQRERWHELPVMRIRAGGPDSVRH
jgi:hypothetical protein